MCIRDRIKTVKGDRAACRAFVEDLKNRVGQPSPEIENSVRDILETVRAEYKRQTLESVLEADQAARRFVLESI